MKRRALFLSCMLLAGCSTHGSYQEIDGGSVTKVEFEQYFGTLTYVIGQEDVEDEVGFEFCLEGKYLIKVKTGDITEFTMNENHALPTNTFSVVLTDESTLTIEADNLSGYFQWTK